MLTKLTFSKDFIFEKHTHDTGKSKPEIWKHDDIILRLHDRSLAHANKLDKVARLFRVPCKWGQRYPRRQSFRLCFAKQGVGPSLLRRRHSAAIPKVRILITALSRKGTCSKRQKSTTDKWRACSFSL